MLCLQLSAGSSLCILHRCLFSFARYYSCWDLEWDGHQLLASKRFIQDTMKGLGLSVSDVTRLDSTATENKFPLIICENFLEKIMFPGIPRNGHNFFCDRSQKKCDHSLITK